MANFDESALNSPVALLTKNRQNWFRIASLVVDFGARVLRHIFKDEWRTVMMRDWQDNIDGPYILNNEYKNIFVMREIHGDQPTRVKSGHVESWDITLLSSLLLNSKTLDFHTRRVTNKRINIIYEFIRGLRNERNSMYGHCSSTELRPGEYQYYLKSIIALFGTVGVSESACMTAISGLRFESPEFVSTLMTREVEYKEVMHRFRDRSFRLLTWVKDHCWSPEEVGTLELGYIDSVALSSTEANIEVDENLALGIDLSNTTMYDFCIPEITLAILPEGIMLPTFRVNSNTKLIGIGNRSLMEKRDYINLSVSTGKCWYVGLDNRFLGVVDVFIAYNIKERCWQLLSDRKSQCTVKVYNDSVKNGAPESTLVGVNNAISIRKGHKLLFGRRNTLKGEKYLNTIEVIHSTSDCNEDKIDMSESTLPRNWSSVMR